MERERRDENHVNASASHSASQHLPPDLHLRHCLLFVSQSEQHVSASPCLLLFTEMASKKVSWPT
jgi:hypothetical protein